MVVPVQDLPEPATCIPAVDKKKGIEAINPGQRHRMHLIALFEGNPFTHLALEGVSEIDFRREISSTVGG